MSRDIAIRPPHEPTEDPSRVRRTIVHAPQVFNGPLFLKPRRYRDRQGYIHIGFMPVKEHIALAESRLGRPLRDGECVHHVNEHKHDNRPENLVICPSQAYHSLLHLRAAAYDATGDVNKRRCCICKQWDDQTNLVKHKSNASPFHKACRNARERKWRQRKYG